MTNPEMKGWLGKNTQTKGEDTWTRYVLLKAGHNCMNSWDTYLKCSSPPTSTRILRERLHTKGLSNSRWYLNIIHWIVPPRTDSVNIYDWPYYGKSWWQEMWHCGRSTHCLPGIRKIKHIFSLSFHSALICLIATRICWWKNNDWICNEYLFIFL